MSLRLEGRLNVTPAAIAACLGLAASTPALAQQAVQWRIQDGGNGHWYQVTGQSSCWTVARDYALSRGGHLATAADISEFQFIASRSSSCSCWVWLGGTRNPNAAITQWTWIDGTPFQFHSITWAGSNPGCCAPDEFYLSLEPGVGVHDFQNCFLSFGAVYPLVEWSADCDGNGIVDYGEILDGTLADTNANGVPDCCDAGVSCDPCPGDLNASGTVDAEDLAYVLFAWGTNGGKTPEAGINRDGTVDANDLSVVLGSWGPCP